MDDSRLRSLLAELERLHSLIGKIVGEASLCDSARRRSEEDLEPGPPRPATAEPSPYPSPEVAELLETIRRTLAIPATGEPGYALVLAVLHPGGSTVSQVRERDLGGVLESDEDLVRLARAFTNMGRLKIVRALARGTRTSSELSGETGLVGGQLYFHLKELMRGGLVVQQARDSYVLSRRVGLPAYLGLNLLVRMIARATGR